MYSSLGRPGILRARLVRLMAGCLVALAAICGGILPAKAGPLQETSSPSPDRCHAIRTTASGSGTTVEVVEVASGKPVCRLADSAAGDAMPRGDALWSPDSQKFAISLGEVRLSSSVSVYVRDGDVFREAELPLVPDPEIPARYENDERLHHWAAIGSWTPVRWLKNGSLEILGQTIRDGNGNWVASERRVILSPGKSGCWRAVSSKDNITAHFE